jgi:hypothetical protein
MEAYFKNYKDYTDESNRIKHQFDDLTLSELPNLRQPIASNLTQQQLAQQYWLGNNDQRERAENIEQSRRRFGYRVNEGGKTRRKRKRRRNRK